MSPTSRDDIVREALTWVGTPYKGLHYPVKGQGCDCASLLLGVGLGVGIFPPGTRLPTYTMDRHLHRSDEAYRAELARQGFTEIPVSGAGPGDVLLHVMGRGQPASHAAILVGAQQGPPRIVHASRSVRRVCVHRIDSHWAARVRFAFRFPGVTDE
jgi:cell wall-associated NlpC family hydrolase